MLLTTHEVMGWLGDFFWPFMRLTGLLLISPFFGNAVIPSLVRVGLSALLAIGLAAWMPHWAPLPDSVPAVILAGSLQIFVGFLVGIGAQMIVTAVAGAGEMAGFTVGTSFATLSLLSTDGAPPVLYDAFYWVGLLVYIGIGGPFWIMEAIHRSFVTLPSGIPTQIGLMNIVDLGGTLLKVAVILALPIMAAGLAMNAVTGLANILAQQLNIFSVGFPLLFLGGIWVLTISVFRVAPAVESMMQTTLHAVGVLVSG